MANCAFQKNYRNGVFILLSLSLFVIVFLNPAPAPAAIDRPNILFIAIDDLNDWTGYLDGCPGKVHTPNIDRLAARGMAFTNAHCSAPVCNASRVSLLTGISPATSGVMSNNMRWRNSPVLKDAVTLPQHFRQSDYHVAGGGKIFHALEWVRYPDGRDGDNDPCSWDEYFPSKIKAMPDPVRPNPSYQRGNDWVSRPVLQGESPAGRRNGKKWRGPHWFFDSAPVDVPDAEMEDSKVIDWAIGQLQQRHDKAFFIAAGIFRPHVPFYAPRKYFEMYPLDEIVLPEEPEGWRSWTPAIAHNVSAIPHQWHEWVKFNGYWKRMVQGYLASVSFADAQVGRLIAALDASPYADNTIVVLWSDHGFHLGERENWEKFTLWEESTRVPFIIAGPEIQIGRCPRAVSLLDIYPTLLALAGQPPRGELEGQSLTPLLRNPTAEWDRPAITQWHNHFSVRSDHFRYICYREGSEELYDHRSDPQERVNLAADPRFAHIKKQLAQWLPVKPHP